MSRLDLIQVFGNENAETFNKISHAYELGRADERTNTINEMLELSQEWKDNHGSFLDFQRVLRSKSKTR